MSSDVCFMQLFHAGSEVLNLRKARLLATAVKRIVRHQDCRCVSNRFSLTEIHLLRCNLRKHYVLDLLQLTMETDRYNFPVLEAVESYLSDLLIVDHETLLARSMKLEPPYRYV